VLNPASSKRDTARRRTKNSSSTMSTRGGDMKPHRERGTFPRRPSDSARSQLHQAPPRRLRR
jgi:hypothetical protein